ncbi:MAG: ribose ABC transporter permease, partial [Chloroflexus aggregans]
MTKASLNWAQRTLVYRQLGTYGILVALAIWFTLFSPQFLTVNNLLTLALQTSLIALVAIGMTFTIITGGIDLSVGSTAALAGA